MSMERCQFCCEPIDTDEDLDCYIADAVLCFWCRDGIDIEGIKTEPTQVSV